MIADRRPDAAHDRDPTAGALVPGPFVDVRDARRSLSARRSLRPGRVPCDGLLARQAAVSRVEPKLAVLDETDSGLDIDALKVVADGVNALRGGSFGKKTIVMKSKRWTIIERRTPSRTERARSTRGVSGR